MNFLEEMVSTDYFKIIKVTLVPNKAEVINIPGDYITYLGSNLTFNTANIYLSDRIWIRPNVDSFDPPGYAAVPFLMPGDGFEKKFNRVWVCMRGFPDPSQNASNNSSNVTAYFAISNGYRFTIQGFNQALLNGTGSEFWTRQNTESNGTALPAHSSILVVQNIPLANKSNFDQLNAFVPLTLDDFMRPGFAINVTGADSQTVASDELWVPSPGFAANVEGTTQTYHLVDATTMNTQTLVEGQNKILSTQAHNHIRFSFHVRSVTGTVNIGLYKGFIDADDGNVTWKSLQMQNGVVAGTFYDFPVIDTNWDFVAIAINMGVSTNAVYATGWLRLTGGE